MKEDTFPPTSIKVPVDVWHSHHEDLKILLDVFGVPLETSILVDDDAYYAFDLPAGWTRRLDEELRKHLHEFMQ
jgi:hypothetical protein